MKPPVELEVRKPATEYIQPSNEVIIRFIILIITILIISPIIFKYIQPSNEVIIRLSDSWQSNKSTYTISIISSIISKQFNISLSTGCIINHIRVYRYRAFKEGEYPSIILSDQTISTPSSFLVSLCNGISCLLLFSVLG